MPAFFYASKKPPCQPANQQQAQLKHTVIVRLTEINFRQGN